MEEAILKTAKPKTPKVEPLEAVSGADVAEMEALEAVSGANAAEAEISEAALEIDTVKAEPPEAALEADMLKIAGIIDESIVDGPGIRYVVFVQGCPHRCEGCHNEQTHDFQDGVDVRLSQLLKEIDADPLITGVTFSGGEPFCQPEPLSVLADEVKRRGLDLMVYSGYTWEELNLMAAENAAVRRLLDTADRLIDGRFVLAERDLELAFRGSRNQRYIDLAKTRAEGRVVLVDEQI